MTILLSGLKVELTKTNSQLQRHSNTLQQIQGGAIKRKATGSDNSERHMRRLKTAQAETCLSWLEKEGLQPVKGKTVNKLTKEEVNISLCPVAEEFNMMKQPLAKNNLIY